MRYRDYRGAIDAETALRRDLAKSVVGYRTARSKGRLECLDQGRFTEWLEQALNGSVLEHTSADRLISVSRDEDNLVWYSVNT